MVTQGTQADADKHLLMSGFQGNCGPYLSARKEKRKGNYKGEFLTGQVSYIIFTRVPQGRLEDRVLLPITEFIVTLSKLGSVTKITLREQLFLLKYVAVFCKFLLSSLQLFREGYDNLDAENVFHRRIY